MADIARGRTQFLNVIGIVGAFMAYGAVGGLLRHGPVGPLGGFGSLIVYAVLAGLAYRGVYWARGAITVWLGLIAILGALRGVLLLRRAPVASLEAFAVAAAVAYGAVFLYNSEHIEAFLLSRDAPPPRPSRRTLPPTDTR